MPGYEFVQRGKVLIVQRQFQDAVRVCRLGLLAHPGLVDGRLVLGMALLELGRFDEVLAEMRVALELEKDSPVGHALKGEALLRKGDARQATEVLERARKLDPKSEKVGALLEEARRNKAVVARASSSQPAAEFSDPSETKLYPAHRGADLVSRAGDDHDDADADDDDDDDDSIEIDTDSQPSSSVTVPAGDPAYWRKLLGRNKGTIDIPRREVLDVGDRSATIELDPDLDGVEVSKSSVELIDRAPSVPAPAARKPAPQVAKAAAKLAAKLPAARPTRQTKPPRDEQSQSGIVLASSDLEEVSSVSSIEATKFKLQAAPEPEDKTGFESSESTGDGRSRIIRAGSAIVEPDDQASGELQYEAAPARPRQKWIEPERLRTVGTALSELEREAEEETGDATAAASPRAAQGGRVARAAPSPSGSTLYDDDEMESTSPNEAELLGGRGAPSPSGAPRAPSAMANLASLASSVPLVAPSSRAAAASLAASLPRVRDPIVSSTSSPPRSSTLGVPRARDGRDAQGRPPSKLPADLTGRTRPAPPTGRLVKSGFTPLSLSLVAVVVIVLAVGAGLFVREARMKRRLRQLNAEAEIALSQQTYRGYWQADALYRAIMTDRGDASARAALACTQSALVYEYGEPDHEAKQFVAELGDDRGRDASCARTYLALSSGDSGEATRAARDFVARFAQDAEAAYLLGLALLGDQDDAAAVEEFRRAAKLDPRPLTLAAIGVAESQRGRYAPAREAFDEALKMVPTHPRATIERARLLALTDDPSLRTEGAGGVEPALLALLQAGAKPNPDGTATVPPMQIGWANLALAEVRIARGDDAGARQSLLAGRESRPRDPRFAEALVRAFLESYDLKAAREEAQRFAKTWPGRGAPHVWLAKIALAEAKPEVAMTELDQAGAAGARPSALAVRGQAKLLLGDTEGAARDLDEAHAALPEDRPITVARAWVDLRRADPRSAISRAEPLYQARKDPDVGIVLGAALRLNGDRARARQILEEAARSPRGGAAHLELARLHRDEGRYAEARAAYARAIEVAPRRLDGRLEAATLLYDLGDATGARAALDQLASEAPDDPEVLLEDARLHTVGADAAGAEKPLETAAKLVSAPRWKVNRERGRMALARRNAALAAKELALATSLYPDDGETRLMLVDAYLALNDAAAAQAVLAEILKRFHGRPEADLARGRIHLAAVHLPQAVAAFDAASKALEVRAAPPRLLADAKTWHGRALYFNGELAKAQALFQDAAKADPSSFNSTYYLGQVLYERGQLPDARNAFEMATKLDPTVADAYFYFGDAAFRLKDVPTAKQALGRYLQLAPKGDFAGEARRMMK